MNWTPEAVQAELEYRTEQAMGDRRTTLEHLRGARASNPSWWRRMRTQHRANHSGPKHAA